MSRELLALELLIGKLIDGAVPLGDMRRAVLSVRESMFEIESGWKGADDTGVALMIVAARELARLAIPEPPER